MHENLQIVYNFKCDCTYLQESHLCFDVLVLNPCFKNFITGSAKVVWMHRGDTWRRHDTKWATTTQGGSACRRPTHSTPSQEARALTSTTPLKWRKTSQPKSLPHFSTFSTAWEILKSHEKNLQKRLSSSVTNYSLRAFQTPNDFSLQNRAKFYQKISNTWPTLGTYATKWQYSSFHLVHHPQFRTALIRKILHLASQRKYFHVLMSNSV